MHERHQISFSIHGSCFLLLQLSLHPPHAPGPDVPDVLEGQVRYSPASGDLGDLLGNVLLARALRK